MMEKADAVAALGKAKLLGPALLKSALAANDRLKFTLTAVQAAAAHALRPDSPRVSLEADHAAAHMNAPWLLDAVEKSWAADGEIHIPDLDRILQQLAEDIAVMARPLTGGGGAPGGPLAERTQAWRQRLSAMRRDALAPPDVERLAGGDRRGEDTLHILVMDLHKALNRLAADQSSEVIDGAHVWDVTPEDRPVIAAFMKGLNSTRALKLDHPGLDTAATRDGTRLLIQNDIGTNDAHVLVIEIEGATISLVYSDLRKRRFAFFRQLLADIGAEWSGVGARTSEGLNAGSSYIVGIARIACADAEALQARLADLGSRIVFLIDWNRARKRLERLVRRRVALGVLNEAARQGLGHMGWLANGGDDLVFAAMEAVGRQQFRMGERLDDALGEDGARLFLLECFALCHAAALARRRTQQVADQVRLLLLRHLARHRDAFSRVADHAALCHALAEGLRDGLAHAAQKHAGAATKLAERAKRWERLADDIVVALREAAATSARLRPFLGLVSASDDCADQLEEAAFLLSVIAESDAGDWSPELAARLGELAGKVLEATQDHVRSLAIAASLTGAGGDVDRAGDQDEFLAACWRVVSAEQACDGLAREVRRQLARDGGKANMVSLVTDFAGAIEAASDALLRAGYLMRDVGFNSVDPIALEMTHER